MTSKLSRFFTKNLKLATQRRPLKPDPNVIGISSVQPAKGQVNITAGLDQLVDQQQTNSNCVIVGLTS